METSRTKNFFKHKYIRNASIASIFIFAFLIIDLALKYCFFDSSVAADTTGQVQYDWKVIGIRSFAHNNSTLFSFLKIAISDGWRVAISLIIGVGITLLLLVQKNKKSVIALSILLAGVFGNSFDNAFYGYVRDIIFTPWMDRGTFNLADVLVVIGAMLFAIFQMFELFNDWGKKKSKDKGETNER